MYVKKTSTNLKDVVLLRTCCERNFLEHRTYIR